MNVKTKKFKNKAPIGRPKDAAKREDIVAAAHKLFMKNGYAMTSMEAVAKKANVSKLTIYSHFANKDALFQEVISNRCAQLMGTGSFMAFADKPANEALRELGLKFTSHIFTQNSLRMHAIMQAESTRHPIVAQIFFENGPKRVREEFKKLLQEWISRGKLSIADIPKATEQFFSLLKGEMLMKIILLQAPMPTEEELKLHVDATVDFFLAAYGRDKK